MGTKLADLKLTHAKRRLEVIERKYNRAHELAQKQSIAEDELDDAELAFIDAQHEVAAAELLAAESS